MPQEMHVIRCYNCEAFQVHIVKKIAKWECKVCGEKQSLKKVYGRGSGKDCRLLVQELNKKRSEIGEEQNMTSNEEININEIDLQNVRFQNNCHPENKSSRWAEFISEPSSVNNHSDDKEINDNEISQYTFERPIKKRKLLKKNNPINSDENSCISEIHTKIKSGHYLPPLTGCSSSRSTKKDFKDLQEEYHKNATVEQGDSTAMNNKCTKFITENDDIQENTNYLTHNKNTYTFSKDITTNSNETNTINCNEKTRMGKWFMSQNENTDLNSANKNNETEVLENFPNSNNSVTTTCKLKSETKCTKWDLFMQENKKDIDGHTVINACTAKTSKVKSFLRNNTNDEILLEGKLKSSKWGMFFNEDENDKNESTNLSFENGQCSSNKLLNVLESNGKDKLKKEESMNKHKQDNEIVLEANQNKLKQKNYCLSFNTSEGDLDSILML